MWMLLFYSIISGFFVTCIVWCLLLFSNNSRKTFFSNFFSRTISYVVNGTVSQTSSPTVVSDNVSCNKSCCEWSTTTLGNREDNPTQTSLFELETVKNTQHGSTLPNLSTPSIAHTTHLDSSSKMCLSNASEECIQYSENKHLTESRETNLRSLDEQKDDLSSDSDHSFQIVNKFPEFELWNCDEPRDNLSDPLVCTVPTLPLHSLESTSMFNQFPKVTASTTSDHPVSVCHDLTYNDNCKESIDYIETTTSRTSKQNDIIEEKNSIVESYETSHSYTNSPRLLNDTPHPETHQQSDGTLTDSEVHIEDAEPSPIDSNRDASMNLNKEANNNMDKQDVEQENDIECIKKNKEIKLERIKQLASNQMNGLPKHSRHDSSYSSTSHRDKDDWVNEDIESDEEENDLDDCNNIEFNEGNKSEILKEMGNKLFKEKNFLKAIKLYTKALLECTTPELGAILLCNRAACSLSLCQYENVIGDCTDAIELHPTYVKGYLRRFRANEALSKWHDALTDINKALELDPSLKGSYDIVQKRVERLSQEQFEKEKQEMIDKLKTFGNWALGKVGLSLDNFKLEQNDATGAYNISFQQNTT